MLKTTRIFKLFLCAIALFSLLTACKKDIDYSTVSKVKPEISASSGEISLDFNEMHNFVIDSISSEATPFFYITEGKFDISGDNEKKDIVISCMCLDGTTVSDLDLFMSAVLNNVAFSASEQDYRFEKPSTDNTGTYTNFGNVFNTYNLKIYAVNESGEIIRDNYIKAGSAIPIEPRYWRE